MNKRQDTPRLFLELLHTFQKHRVRHGLVIERSRVAASLCRANLRPGAMLPLGVVPMVLVVKLDRLPDLNQLPFVILGNVESKMPCPMTRKDLASDVFFCGVSSGGFRSFGSNRQHKRCQLVAKLLIIKLRP